MRIAVTGSRGQIVRALLERAAAYDAEILPVGRPHLDLADPATIIGALESLAPEVIVNAGAYTAVDAAESEEPLAQQINGVGAGKVADAANRLGVPVIQFSTGYVFDGAHGRAYREADAAEPINAYGRSKLSGEQAVQKAMRRHVILRTAWVYSPFGTNFVRTMLRLGETQNHVRVVADQFGQPSSALDIADGVLTICAKLKGHPDEQRLFGIFHMAGCGETCWADFATAIFAEAERCGRPRVVVAPITSEQYAAAVRRPKNARLDTRKLDEIYGVALPSWRDSLPAVVARLLQIG
ncbi:MAG: dTDP-4-dehydrorhamnose reductase [Methylovirgula sp.]